MKRFLAWWRNGPPLHVHFIDSDKETNPLAERAIESLHQATATLERTLNLVNVLQTQLACVRSELAAYAAAAMEEDAQVAELERMQGRTL